MRQNALRFQSLCLKEHTVEVTHLAGIQSLEVLKVCVHAEKKMGTIRMALKIPITIATLIMLVCFLTLVVGTRIL